VTECYYCGFTTKSRAAMVTLESGLTRCKSGDACMRRLRAGTHLKRRVRLTLEAPDVASPPLVSADRIKAEKHERYRRGICIDCGACPHSAGRPRCNGCHAKLIAYRALGRGDG
jgi:hypothetical protein